MLEPTFPNYAGYTYSCFCANDNYYFVGYYSDLRGDGSIHNGFIATLTKNDMQEVSRFMPSYIDTWDMPHSLHIDNEGYLWCSHRKYGIESYLIDASGSLTPIQKFNSNNVNVRISISPEYICSPVYEANLKIFQRIGHGQVNTTPVATISINKRYSDKRTIGNEIFYSGINHESNIWYVFSSAATDNVEYMIDLSSLTQINIPTNGGDFNTSGFDPVDETFYNFKPRFYWARNSILGFNYINTDKTFEPIENYDPDTATDYEKEIYNSGNILNWYSMDTDSTTTQMDRSGNKLDFSGSGLTPLQNSLRKDGKSVYIDEYAAMQIYKPSFNLANFTIECWVKVDSYAKDTSRQLFGFSRDQVGSVAYGVGINNGNSAPINHIFASIWDSNASDAITISNKYLIDYDKPIHLVLVRRNTTTHECWLNGIKIGETNTNIWFNSGTYQYLTINYAATNYTRNRQYFQDFVIYDKALSESEIQSHYAVGIGKLQFSQRIQNILAKNPVAYWKFDRFNDTNQILDLTNNNHHLTVSGGVQDGISSIIDDSDDTTNRAMYFDAATTGEAYTTSNINAEYLSNFTYEMWIKTGVNSGEYTYIGCINESNNTIGTAFGISPSLQLEFRYWDGAEQNTNSYQLEENSIYHIVATRSNTNRKLYVNGALVGIINSNTVGIAGYDEFIFNGDNNAASGHQNFTLDEFVIYDTVLSESEIWNNYYNYHPNKNKYRDSILQKNPLAYYPCDDPTGSATIKDISGNFQDMVPVNVTYEHVGIDENKCIYIGDNTCQAYSQNEFILSNMNEISVEFWFKPTQFIGSNNTSMYALIRSQNNELQFATYYYTSSFFRFALQFKYPNTVYFDDYTKQNIQINKWHHIVTTLDITNQIQKTYLNGQLLGIHNGDVQSFTENLSLLIAGNGTYSSTIYRVDSYYQHIAVYDTILTDTEILDHYHTLAPLSAQKDSDLATYIIDDNPVCYWKLNETTGNTVYDSMGRCNGIIMNGVADTMKSIGLNLSKPDESALNFNGSDQYIDMGDNIQPLLATDSFSAEALVWTNVLDGTNHAIISCTELTGYNIIIDTLNQALSSLYHKIDGFLYTSSPNTSISSSKLHHVCFTFDGNSINLYVDGILTTTTNASIHDRIDFSTNIVKFLIGAEYGATSNSDFWNGRIAHVAIYDKVLTQDKIINRYLAATGHSPLHDGQYTTFLKSRNPRALWSLNDNISRSKVVVDLMKQGDNDLYPYNTLLEQQEVLVNEDSTSINPDGTGYLRTTKSSNTDLNLTGTVSFEGWIKYNGSYQIMIASITPDESVSTNDRFRCTLTTTGVNYFHEYGSGTNQYGSIPYTFINNEIYHIVLMRDNTNKKYILYVNGSYVGESSYTINPDGTNTTISMFIDDVTQVGSTPQSHVAVYERLLTTNEILESYQEGKKTLLTLKPADYTVNFNTLPPKIEETRQTFTTSGTLALAQDQKGTVDDAVRYDTINYSSMDNAVCPFNVKQDSFTINAWISQYGADTGNYRMFFGYQDSSNNYGFSVYSNNPANGGNTSLSIYWKDSTGTNQYINIIDSIPLTGWFMLSITYDRTTLNVYINGNSVYSGLADIAEVGITSPFRFGNDAGNIPNNFDISEFLYWKEVLTPDDISILYLNKSSKYRIYGNVTEFDKPVSRTVRIYDRQTGELVKEVKSSETGMFDVRWYLLNNSRQYYITVLDDDEGYIFDPITHDRIFAKIT